MRVAIVHYHLDPGGVRSVIEITSLALTKARVHHLIFSGSKGPSQLPTYQIDGLGYQSSAGQITAKQVVTTMKAAAVRLLGGTPDVWHFHNHSLGKNPLIPLVVDYLVKQREPLLLHLHDLAENGRPQNYNLIKDFSNLYPYSSRIRYAFLNSRDREIFVKAGLPPTCAELLENPISAKHVISIPCNDRSKIVFAPIRGIRRKNLGELILLSALAPSGTHFAVSRAPQNLDALLVHHHWQKFAIQYRLPITFNVVDRCAPSGESDTSFKSWMEHCSHLVSTSVEEGFGLTFLEAIALGKPLFGRNLPHITADQMHRDITFGSLYDRILIPIEWININDLKVFLRATVDRSSQRYQYPLTRSYADDIFQLMTCDHLIDFGNLPEIFQQQVIEKITEKDYRKTPLAEIGKCRMPLETWLLEALLETLPFSTPEKLKRYSKDASVRRLKHIYQDLIDSSSREPSYLVPATILKSHLKPERFHFLMSMPPPLTSPVNYRAVIFDIYGTLLLAPFGGIKKDLLADPILKKTIEAAGFIPPDFPSSDLHAAVIRYHAESTMDFPEVDLRQLWKEILSLSSDQNIDKLVIALENVWHPSSLLTGAKQAVEKLARKSISLGLLSNAQSNTLTSLGDIAGLFASDLTILSYEHGIAKPSQKLFEMMRDRLLDQKISPGETLFIGNDPLHDILPAASVGFSTALFIGHPDSFRSGICHPDHLLESWAELDTLF
jgi:FMN phosphatase YigB (HAD superfamily)/glycosyltransferase involved in cell wall biosynthesis